MVWRGLREEFRFLSDRRIPGRTGRESRAVVGPVPAEFFDELLAALDASPAPSPALTAAGRRARRILTQR
jgi:hypothetical protein